MAVDHDHIARARLRVDTRKWLLSKALPKVFGDRNIAEHSGAIKPSVPRDPGPGYLARLAKRFAEGAAR